MKKLLAIASIAVAAQFGFALPAFAAAEKAATPQQQRMRDCNKEAEGLKGQERKDFMKQCLSGKQAAAKEARSAQREKMKACNAEAGEKKLKGDARKKFMSECLSN